MSDATDGFDAAFAAFWVNWCGVFANEVQARAIFQEAFNAGAASVKRTRTKKAEADPGEQGVRFAEWFARLLPPTMTPDQARGRKWALCYDALIAEGRTARQIADVCVWARADKFWSTAFFSPLKLRDKKDGVTYFDRFAAGMNPAAARRAVNATREYSTQRKPGVIE